MKALVRSALIVVGGAWLAGCAVASAPKAKPAAVIPAAAALELDGVVDGVWKAFAADDLGAVYDRMDARMVRALTSDQLRAVWVAVVDEVGPLRSWQITKRSDLGGHTNFICDLVHERGHMTGDITLAKADHLIAGLYLRPESNNKQPAGAPAASVAAEPKAAPALQPIPASPPEFIARTVRIGRPPLELDGLLTAPPGPGRFPAVVLIAGSGPADKDETVGANKPFRDIAEGLARKGIVALRYDKRTRAHPEKLDLHNVTVEQEVLADAVSALDVLRAQPEVDGAAIFVVGHSLGAQLAPEIAKRDGRTRGMVLLAPPARPLATAAVEQLRFLKALPPEQLTKLEQQAAAIVRGTAAPTDTFMGVPVSYFLDLQKRNPVRLMKSLGKPVLILRGDRDYQVNETEFKIWKAGSKAIAGSQAFVLPTLNHLFIAGQGAPGPAEYAVPGKVSAAALVRISAFIKGVTSSGR